jgi:hypothetical protein
MMLIIVYVASIIGGDLAAFGIAKVVERFSDTGSLVVFLTLYFLVFGIAWHFAVRVTAPKQATSKVAGSS